MKTTVDISEPLLDEARELARREGTTLRSLVEQGLRRIIAERAETARKPFRLRDASFGGNGLQPEFRDAEWGQIRDAIYKGRGG